MDETYIKVGGKWGYLYRAVDKEGMQYPHRKINASASATRLRYS
tara:strand:+ start:545 stop:676 length:132 start_codon:yes stop_codon:yes gene_type:complete